MRRVLVVAGLVVVALAAWRWYGGDRARIERRLDRLLRACEKSGPDSPLSLLERSRTLADSFAPGFVVSARPYEGSITDTRELAGVVQRYRSTARTVRVTTSESRLELEEGGTAEMSAVFAVRGDRGAGPGAERFRARLFWVREGGEWRIREFEIVEVIESSGLFF